MNTEAAQQKQYPVLVLMGVSGSGKSTVGGMLAGAMGWDLQEGDDLHPQANIDKMATGHPLNDEDRWPWLDKIAVWIKSHTDAGQPGIVTCSALKRSYRDVLRGEHVVFVHLAGSRDQIGQRLTARSITTCPPRCSTPRSRHSRPSTRTNRPSSSTWAGVPPRSRRRSCDAWRHSNTEQARRVSTRGSGYGAWVTAAEEGHDVDQLRVDAQARLEVAVGEGRLTLEEYSDKAAVVWSPTADRGQLEQIVPFSAAPPAVVSPPQATIVGVFGDTKRSGRWSLAKKTLALLLFGDVKFDLRSATITASSSTITIVSIFGGDTRLRVPEGVSVELGGFDLFGDREFDGGRQDPGPGAPVIRVVAYSLFGDLTVRTG